MDGPTTLSFGYLPGPSDLHWCARSLARSRSPKNLFSTVTSSPPDRFALGHLAALRPWRRLCTDAMSFRGATDGSTRASFSKWKAEPGSAAMANKAHRTAQKKRTAFPGRTDRGALVVGAFRPQRQIGIQEKTSRRRRSGAGGDQTETTRRNQREKANRQQGREAALPLFAFPTDCPPFFTHPAPGIPLLIGQHRLRGGHPTVRERNLSLSLLL